MRYDFTIYQNQAVRTFNGDNNKLNEEAKLSLCGLGLAGESGELADYIKKVLYHGKPLDRDHIIKELGDILWYISILATVLGEPLENIAMRNIEKLKSRYPDGFSHEASNNRNEK